MPTNRITMRRIRETLRLHLQAGLSYNEVGRALKISKSAVGKYVSLARVAGVDWVVAQTLSDEELEARLHKRPHAKPGVTWDVAMRPSARKPYQKTGKIGALVDQIEHLKASVQAKVEHPFRLIKRQFGHVKVRYRGLAKNTAQLHTLFALSNLSKARRPLVTLQAVVRPVNAKAP